MNEGASAEGGISDAELRIWKYQALGNSYLVLDSNDLTLAAQFLDEPDELGARPSPGLVSALCDKSWGIGANGLLFGFSPLSASNNFLLRIINSDGTGAGFSGNGVRIFAQYLIDKKRVERDSEFRVLVIEQQPDSALTTNTVRIRIDGTGQIEVTVPQVPKFGPEAILADPSSIQRLDPANKLSYKVERLAAAGAMLLGRPDVWANSTMLDIGNPHCVTFVDAEENLPSVPLLDKAFELLQPISFRPNDDPTNRPVFGRGSNLQWAFVRSRSRIALRIFERGEGPTLASGSSATAAAAAAFARGLVDNRIDVEMPGGVLPIVIVGTPENIHDVKLKGTAARIADCRVSIATLMSYKALFRYNHRGSQRTFEQARIDSHPKTEP